MIFRARDVSAVELMEDPECDPDALQRTYRQFALVNRVVSGWRRTYQHRIRPRFTTREHTLLDVGTGGGDIARLLSRWATRDGVRLSVTGIDPDERAFQFLSAREPASLRHGTEVEWLCTDTSSLVEQGRSFDFVVSNHVLHHLSAPELGALLVDSERLANTAVIHSDIRRSAVAYALFSLLTAPLIMAPKQRQSFIRVDGLTSIRRSFTLSEAAEAFPQPWSVRSQTPYRLLLLYEGKRHV
ncbi:methyltransferase domain-containing protein [Lysinibacter sp. HNR]|uniref:methyltransferase domain-containing protein n=1 Tax=Lysinibacter sp. HNR TaxID=3031408 RepID=UPI0024359685|nr:methyltransferase domain-containing protein [Lysinibacter sp. HNR]WGD36644.1 methyltransferase domain-containing protein [Lysinibacter sp. HNR]